MGFINQLIADLRIDARARCRTSSQCSEKLQGEVRRYKKQPDRFALKGQILRQFKKKFGRDLQVASGSADALAKLVGHRHSCDADSLLVAVQIPGSPKIRLKELSCV